MQDTCTEILTKHRRRDTKVRKLLLEHLHSAPAPLSPPEIVELLHRAGRKVNKTTVYRDLELLTRIGIVRKVVVSDRKQYFELTERGHHHHLICVECEKIEDIVFSEEPQFLERNQTAVTRKGFSVLRHSIELFGICKQCS